MTGRRTGGGAAGFSLVEMVIAISFLLVSTVAVGLAMQAGMRTTRELSDAQAVQVTAQSFMDRILRQNFGQSSDPDPTGGQVQAVFDLTGSPGTITLNQLSRWPQAAGGWRFTLADFPVIGQWRVAVSADLDGDGKTTGPIENLNTVFAVRIYFQDQLVLMSSLSKEVSL